MKTNWDYTALADAYLKRPDYSNDAIDQIFNKAKLQGVGYICDIGAGTGKLSYMLLERGYDVISVEPNDAMREHGIANTKHYEKSKWFEATGEDTKQAAGHFDLVTFGSSFNVVDRQAALKEVHRILKPFGWFACMWNHRDLDDPIQCAIENIIKNEIDEYDYGVRREDQTSIIAASGLFQDAGKIEGTVIHTQRVTDCLEAWKSHATLQRQAGERFGQVIDQITRYLDSLQVDSIEVPYTTRVWIAQRLG
jgi:SAM-dependent methyltransferase